MTVNVDLLLEILNSLLTISCGFILIYFLSIKKLLRNNIFYYGWAAGFILYGFQILMRALEYGIFVTSIPMTVAFIVFQLSTWALDRRKRLIFLFVPFIISYLFIMVLFFLKIMQYSENMWIIGSTLLYLPVALLIMAHRKLFGACVDRLLIGWFSLFLINILMPEGGWIADSLAIFCKLLILTGIMSYDFAVITQKIRRELTSHTYPFTTGYNKEGGLNLVMFKSRSESPLKIVSEWLRGKVEENVRENIETYIIVLQNVIPYSVLRSLAWSKPELVHFFIFSENPESSEEFTTLTFGETELGATITEITRRKNGKKEIILIDLSIMIHTFGPKQAYRLLLNKLGMLRSSGTLLTAVLHPDTHEESIVALFKTITDSIQQT